MFQRTFQVECHAFHQDAELEFEQARNPLAWDLECVPSVEKLQSSFDDQAVGWNVTFVVDLVVQLELDFLKGFDGDDLYSVVCNVAVNGRGAD